MTLKDVIARLSETQKRALGRIALNDDAGLDPRTLAVLLSKSLVVESIEKRGIVQIKRYSVTIPVHMAWCEWCAENVPDDEEEGA